jgi:soluble lytic murein transglycosylase-like protein
MRRVGSILIIAMLLMPVTVHAIEMPEDIRAYNAEAEAETSVSRYLLGGLEYWESGFNDHAVNKAGNCFGLCQINPKYHTARMERLGVKDICDRRGNIRVAADLLAELFEEHEDIGMVLLVYGGASEKAKARYLADGTLPRWAQRIIDKAQEYEREEVTTDADRRDADAAVPGDPDA